jgi:hypothetical protein
MKLGAVSAGDEVDYLCYSPVGMSCSWYIYIVVLANLCIK